MIFKPTLPADLFVNDLKKIVVYIENMFVKDWDVDMVVYGILKQAKTWLIKEPRSRDEMDLELIFKNVHKNTEQFIKYRVYKDKKENVYIVELGNELYRLDDPITIDYIKAYLEFVSEARKLSENVKGFIKVLENLAIAYAKYLQHSQKLQYGVGGTQHSI